LRSFCPFQSAVIEDRNRNAPPQATAKIGIRIDRNAVGIGNKQHDRFDRPPYRFFEKRDLLRDREETLERRVAEIDYFRDRVVNNQAVEHRHLTPDLAEIRDLRKAGQIIAERISARVEIEDDRIGALEPQKIDQQPRDKGLSHLRTRTRNDEDRCVLFFRCRRTAAAARVLVCVLQDRFVSLASRHGRACASRVPAPLPPRRWAPGLQRCRSG
jgi:hypothetical protein